MHSQSTQPHFATLVLLSWLSVLSINLFLPSLAGIAAEFDADYALVSWSIAGYLAVTAVLQLVAGPLSDRFGRRPVLLVSLAAFAVASAGCLVAGDIYVFLACRMMQGAIIMGWVLSLAIIRDTTQDGDTASRIGYVTTAMAIAPMVGPILGGALEEWFGWRASFTFYAASGAALFAWCWKDLRETNTDRSSTFAEQFSAYPELFGSQRFWGYSLCKAFSIGAFYSFLAGAPYVGTAILGLSAAQLGFGLGSITAGFVFGSFLSGRYSRRFALTSMMFAGRIIACAGPAVAIALATGGIVNAYVIFGAAICVGLGNGLTMPSCNAGVMSVRPRLAGSASGLSGALTVAGGAVFSWASGVAVTAANGAIALPAMMLATSAMGLGATLYVMAVDRREAALGATS